MDRTEALSKLSDENAHSRLTAVRDLTADDGSDVFEALQARLAVETDYFVRKAVVEAIARHPRLAEIALDAHRDESGKDAELTERLGHQLLHELEPIVGLLRLAARRELGGRFEKSETHKRLKHLGLALQALEQITLASAVPALEEFDLPPLVDEVGEECSSGTAFEVEGAGPRPFPVTADRSLLRLALRNAIANALDATREAGSEATVVVTWGRSKDEFQVGVLDRGVGLPASIDELGDASQTTKPGHKGLGLSLIERAIDSLHGKVMLVRRDDGGTRVELRWPRSET